MNLEVHMKEKNTEQSSLKIILASSERIVYFIPSSIDISSVG